MSTRFESLVGVQCVQRLKRAEVSSVMFSSLSRSFGGIGSQAVLRRNFSFPYLGILTSHTYIRFYLLIVTISGLEYRFPLCISHIYLVTSGLAVLPCQRMKIFRSELCLQCISTSAGGPCQGQILSLQSSSER